MMVMQIEEEGKTASEEELKEMFRYMDKFVIYYIYVHVEIKVTNLTLSLSKKPT